MKEMKMMSVDSFIFTHIPAQTLTQIPHTKSEPKE